MGFSNYLIEDYVEASTEQLSILRQDLDRNALRSAIDKIYISKSDIDITLFNNDYYISGIALGDDDTVLISLSVIIEVTEEDNYLYYKIADIKYDVDNKKIIKIKENDKIRNENWKTVQSEILKTAKKL